MEEENKKVQLKLKEEKERVRKENELAEKKEKKKMQKKKDKRFPVEEPTDWIHWFSKLKGNEYFVEVDEDFIKKEENLYYIYS